MILPSYWIFTLSAILTSFSEPNFQASDSIVYQGNMPICIHCSSIDLIGLWATKSPRLHKPSLPALVFSAEDCPSCEIILDSLSTRPVLGLPLPTLLEPSTPLAVATINGYKYTTAVTDNPVNIDCLLFYFDDRFNIQGVDNVGGKADPEYAGSWLDIFSGQW